MCNEAESVTSSEENSATFTRNQPAKDKSSRFVFYHVDDGEQEELARESNFSEIVSREKSDFISKDDLDDSI